MRRLGVVFSAVVVLLWPVDEGRAQCAATGTNQTCTNPQGTTISGGASGIVDSGTDLTVENRGIITGSGGTSTAGIQAAGNANVTNSGTITGFQGITSGVTATVINSGTITGTGGLGTAGINAHDANVTNSGTLSGSDYGVFANVVTVTNSGTISGDFAGVFANFSNATVTNYGSISGNNYGVFAQVNATVANSGTISGGYFGIYSENSANITNTGTISGGFAGISALGAVNIVNSGTITSGLGTAMRLSSADDTLTLLPGSRIIGTIDMGAGHDIVNHVAGAGLSSLLTFANVETINGSGSVPLVVAGNRIATLDPTAFAMTDRNLMDFTRGISGIVGSRGDAGTADGARSGAASAFAADTGSASAYGGGPFADIPALAYAEAGAAAVFKAPSVVSADGTAAWARGFAGQRVQQADGVLLHTTNQFYGGVVGLDGPAHTDLRVGGFIGGGATRSSIDHVNHTSGAIDSDVIFAGAYGRWSLGAGHLDFSVHGGHLSDTTSRTIFDNLAPGGLAKATAKHDGWYASPEIAFGYRHALGAGFAVTPVVRVRYVAAGLDGYTETGSTAPLTVASRTIQDIEERGEVKLSHTTVFTPRETLTWAVHGGVLGLQRLGDTTVDTILLGQDLAFATPGRNGVGGVFGGLGFDWRTQNVTWFAGAEYLAMSDSSSTVSGKGGFRVGF